MNAKDKHRAEQIKRLAKWAGIYVVEIEELPDPERYKEWDLRFRVHVVIDSFRHAWAPFTYLPDAWMLIERVQWYIKNRPEAKDLDSYMSWIIPVAVQDQLVEILKESVTMTAEETARKITDTVLAAIKK